MGQLPYSLSQIETIRYVKPMTTTDVHRKTTLMNQYQQRLIFSVNRVKTPDALPGLSGTERNVTMKA